MSATSQSNQLTSNLLELGLRALRQYLPHWLAMPLKAWRDQLQVRCRYRQAVANLRSAAIAMSRDCLEGIETLAEWERQRPRLLGQLQWMLGLDPLPPRTPLAPEITGVLERAEYRIEKLVFQSVPGMHVTANFYVQREMRRPVACVVYLCGHRPHPCGAKTQYQERFLWYPAHGFACFVVDSVQCGEVPGLHLGTRELNLWDWLSMGYTPAGLEVWNAMRALDYLATRSEVDSQRIGVTGVSGGGIMTLLLAALDERIKAAAPSCSTYTIGSQVRRGLVPFQCDCTFYPNVFRLDFPTVAALIAPRPLLITSGKRDRIFPPLGSREVFRRAKWVYDLYGTGEQGSERIRAVESNAGHADPPLFLQEQRRWMSCWLHPEPSSLLPFVCDACPAPSPVENLACIGRPPRESANYTIHNHFLSRASLALPGSPAAWQTRREQLLQHLRGTVFSWFPSLSAPVSVRSLPGLGGYASLFAHFSEWLLETEPGVPVRAIRFRPKVSAPNQSLVIVVRRLGDCMFLFDEALPLLGTHTVIVLNPRFTEHIPSAAEYADLERTAALTGRTLAALQVWDVMCTVHWALEEQRVPPERVSIYGRGTAGIVALYAGLFEPRVNQIILSEPPASHRDGPALLTVLRTTDIPEAAAALAPRELSMLSEPPGPFEFTRHVYRLWGAEHSFQVCRSLPAALLPGDDTPK